MTAPSQPKCFSPASPEFAAGYRSGLLKLNDHLQALLQQNPEARRAGTGQSASAEMKVRRLIRARARRSHYFADDLFADPAWDMLLELFAAHMAQQRVTIINLCLASGAPTTTALRWISALEKLGMITRQSDPLDRRRTYLRLSEGAVQAMQAYVERELQS